MASELRVNTLKDASGNNSVAMTYVAEGTAKAWANITTASTIGINDSFNISGVVDNAAAQTTYSFTSSFNNNDYSALGTSGDNGLIANFPQTDHAPATGSIRGITVTDPSTTADPASQVNSAMLGDLA
tara:strand:+ start:363 stop:746 length:384 start_codon:yes stop_codon:yes gene_type:complete